MTPLRRFRLVLVGLVVLAGHGAVQAAALSGDWVDLTSPLAEDLYAAGRDVRIGARVAGDVTAAGMSVRIEAIVDDDVIVAAEHVRIAAPVVDDVRAAGRRVEIAADVGDHVVAAGERIEVAEGVSIGGFAWFAARELRLGGRIGGDLRVAAERVILEGEIAGDAEITAERIEMRPGARIGGDLSWRSAAEPAIAEEAEVAGRVDGQPLPGPMPARGARLWGLVFLAVTLLATGAVLYLVLPGCFGAVATATRARPGISIALGLAVLAATPLVIVLLLVTGVGWLLAMLLLFGYLLGLVIAWFVAAFTLGTVALPRARHAAGLRHGVVWLALLGGILMLVLLQLVPMLGGFVALFAVIAGLGGMGLGCYSRQAAGS